MGPFSHWEGDASMRSKLALPLAALVAGTLLFGGTAVAGGGTSVTIKGDQGDFHGKVITRDGCRAERTVKVFKIKDDENVNIGSDTTAEDGKWSTGNSGYKNGRFFAKLKASEECEGARSETIRLKDGEQV